MNFVYMDSLIDVKRRTVEYQEYLGFADNNKAMALKLGISPSSYGEFINKPETFSKVAFLICQKFPDLNCNWLFRGVGNMSVQEEWRQAEQTGQMKEAAAPTIHHDTGYPNEDWRKQLKVAEGDSIDLIWYNVLLRENAEMKHEIDILRRRNLELERRTAIAEDRIQNAEKWYNDNIVNKKR